MANLEMLKAKIVESGMPKTTVAKRAEIEIYTLDRRLNGIGEFRASEIVGLTKALHLKTSEVNEIFLT